MEYKYDNDKVARQVYKKCKEILDDDLRESLSDNPYVRGVPELLQVQLTRTLNRLNKNLEAMIQKQ